MVGEKTDLVWIGNAQIRASIHALGAELQSLTSHDGRDWLWHGDAQFWSGRSPVLFPIVGRAPGDILTIGAHQAPMAQHGFARRRAFELIELGPDHCRHHLRADADSRAVYPCDFSLSLEHRLDAAELQVTAEVENLDENPIPFQLGFHPAFLWPLPGQAGEPHEITLENRGEPGLARVEGGLLSPLCHPSPFRAGHLVLDPARFAADAMIFPDGTGTALRYGPKRGPALWFRFENLPNLALWSKAGSPFLCIEPWHGMAARIGDSPELADRPQAMTLPPGGKARFGWSVRIDQAA